MPDAPSATEARRLRRALLAWFREHRRPLPFRSDPDPWRIWVSEVMLQQTRVEAMLPRYRAFLARFPDIDSLARATEDEVLAAWAGLGYYGRARSLHRAVRRLAAEGRGIPRTAAALRELPGVGDYTAAAVGSIAFGEPVAAVDGNVRRVLARLFAVGGVPGRAPFERPIRALADRLMAADGGCHPGDWNQALMELGALVCTPVAPGCRDCPLERVCQARSVGREEELPERRGRPATVPVRLALAVVRDGDGRVLLFRRRESPMRGLYELPCGECGSGESPEDALVREATARYGIRLLPGRELAGFRHTVMNQRIVAFPFEATLREPEAGAALRGGRFVHPREVGEIPSGSILRKALAGIGAASSESASRPGTAEDRPDRG